MNKKGAVIIPVIIIGVLMSGVIGKATYETAKNGTLKNNGKTVWCKIQGKTTCK